MNETPEISVLLPVRDAAPWVRESVQDVLRQEDVPLELVAVDDGSTDASRAVLEELAVRDSRLRVLQNPGSGPAAALNAGLAQARGRWIGQMEADDRCPAHRFRVLRDALQGAPDWQGVVSGAEAIGAVRPGMERYLAWQNRLHGPEELRRGRFVEIPALHQTGLYRRELFEAVGEFRDDPRWPLDIDFWMRVFEAGSQVGKVPDILYQWRQHPRQTTRVSARHQQSALRRCKAHYFMRGPGHQRPVDLLSVGRTLADWAVALQEAGATTLRKIEWRPGAAAPARAPGAVRLLAYGMAKAREMARQALPEFDPDRDWFAG